MKISRRFFAALVSAALAGPTSAGPDAATLGAAFDGSTPADASPSRERRGMGVGVSAGTALGRLTGSSATVDLDVPLNGRGLSFTARVGSQRAAYDETVDASGIKRWTELAAFVPAGLEQELPGLALGRGHEGAKVRLAPFVGVGLALGAVEHHDDDGRNDLAPDPSAPRNRTLAAPCASAGLRLAVEGGPSVGVHVQRIENNVQSRRDATFVGGSASWTFRGR